MLNIAYTWSSICHWKLLFRCSFYHRPNMPQKMSIDSLLNYVKLIDPCFLRVKRCEKFRRVPELLLRRTFIWYFLLFLDPSIFFFHSPISSALYIFPWTQIPAKRTRWCFLPSFPFFPPSQLLSAQPRIKSTSTTKKPSSERSFLTQHFAIFKPQNPLIDTFYVVKTSNWWTLRI